MTDTPWISTWAAITDVAVPVSIVCIPAIFAWRKGPIFARARAHLETYIELGEDPGQRADDALWLFARIASCELCLSYQLPVWLLLMYFWQSGAAVLAAVGLAVVSIWLSRWFGPRLAPLVGAVGAGSAYITHVVWLFWYGSVVTATQFLSAWAGAVAIVAAVCVILPDLVDRINHGGADAER
jgi:hypothetical protein